MMEGGDGIMEIYLYQIFFAIIGRLAGHLLCKLVDKLIHMFMQNRQQ